MIDLKIVVHIGWSYIFQPTLHVYRMPYPNLRILRPALRGIWDQGIKMENRWAKELEAEVKHKPLVREVPFGLRDPSKPRRPQPREIEDLAALPKLETNERSSEERKLTMAERLDMKVTKDVMALFDSPPVRVLSTFQYLDLTPFWLSSAMVQRFLTSDRT
jgi:hypothetical protein